MSLEKLAGLGKWLGELGGEHVVPPALGQPKAQEALRVQGLRAILGRDWPTFYRHMGEGKTFKKYRAGEKPPLQLAKMLPKYYLTTPSGLRTKRTAFMAGGIGALGAAIYLGSKLRKKSIDEKIDKVVSEKLRKFQGVPRISRRDIQVGALLQGDRATANTAR